MSKAKKIVSSKPFIMLVWVLVLVAIWEMGAANMEKTKRTPENVLPHVSQIVASVFSDKMVSNSQTATQIVWSSAEATLERAFIGFLFGTIFGFLMALLMKLSGLVEKTIFPYLMLIQMIPIIGMAPIILAITHDIGTSRIVIAAILTFYPVATNTLAGLNSVSKEKYELMYSYAASKWTIYRKVLIPSCIPYFFTGLKISAPMAITASILVDTLQGDGGLGCMLSQSLKHAMSIYVFWQIVFFSAFVGILSSVLMGVIEKRVSPHMRADRKRRKKV
ncbi:NitT/TauT family transport system permease protein [Anaerosporobacter mobilis DSM 15930]|jgi:NitT/TauT family transport system permease protein|uniref:NitT/TauT family transport system permease protein n=1 Tax=Anaerosporobacter mobilis DSM 15930 TaxID=1120996 RepID=A0A1M7F221_9FIRM|nr:ABC transporter permease [Anaerosporobacter mobilis]SHL98053.1 NitT/TauT family transport system permease protein [Anaerosporobacter mobilis DSM 15930]